VLLVAFLKMILFYFVGVIPLAVLRKIIDVPLEIRLFYYSILNLLILLLILRGLFKKGYKIDKLLRLNTLSAKLLLPIFMLGMGFTIVSGQIDSMIRFIANSYLAMDLKSNDVELPQYLWGWIPFIISGAFLAPVYEELVFRGILFGQLEKKSGLVTAIITSSLIFGILHFNISASITIAIEFSFITYIVYKTNSIISSIIIHIINNAISLVIYPFYKLEDLGFFPNLESGIRIPIEIMIFLFGFALIIIGYSKLFSRDNIPGQHSIFCM